LKKKNFVVLYSGGRQRWKRLEWTSQDHWATTQDGISRRQLQPNGDEATFDCFSASVPFKTKDRWEGEKLRKWKNEKLGTDLEGKRRVGLKREGEKRRHDNQRNDIKHNDTQHNDIQHNDTQHNDTQYWVALCCMSFMLCMANNPIMLCVIMLSVIMVSVIMLSVIMLMLSVTILSVIMLSVSLCWVSLCW
jgi:hypothetical protein